jgi:hypothetical protein
VHATADANGQLISNGLVRLMSKLASQANRGKDAARPVADGALRDQIIHLLAGWELVDPNPEHYSRLLQHLASQAADAPSETLKDSDNDDVEHAIRIVQIALEVGTTGHTVERAIDRLAADGHAAEIVDLLKARPPGSEQAAKEIIAQLVRPSSLSTLVNREPLDEASLDALLPFLSEEGFQTLLDALASSENRATRRKLIDRLARAALDTGPYIAARLEDERWYVLRNMLLLMERSGHVPEGFSATRWTTHQDARVRYEALRLQLTIARERDRAIRTAIDDEDPRIVRLGLATLQQECSPAYAARIAAIAVDPKTDAELRLLAVNALGRIREPGALEVLLAVVDGGRTFFGRPKLAPKTPVMLAAMRGLAQTWSDHPRATAVLGRAVQSPDAEVRQASQSPPS